MNERGGAAPGTALHDYARVELESAITRLGWRDCGNASRARPGVHNPEQTSALRHG